MELLCNSLTPKDLLADLGTISYDSGVTEEQFWRTVGRELADKRKERRTTAIAIEQKGGPTNKTVQDIEAGKVGQLSKLREYAAIVGVDLIDLFRSVLRADEEGGGPELQFVIRQFKRAGVKGRAAFVQVAELLEDRSERPPQGSHDDRSGVKPETSRGRNAAAKRRVTK